MSDNGSVINDIPSEPTGLGSSVSTSNDNGGVIDLDNIPSKPPGLGSCLSSSPIVIGVEYKYGIDETLSKPAGRGKRINETPSKPPGHSFCVSTWIDDGVIELNNDGRINVLITDDMICIFTLHTLGWGECCG